MFILPKTRKPAYGQQFSNWAITWYEIDSVGYLNQNIVFQEL